MLPSVLFGGLAVLGLGFILMPARLRPVHSLWLQAAHTVGRVVTGLILVVAYYLVITPTAWLKRLLGGRPLPIRPDPNAATYWVEREEPVQPPERFLKRF